MANFKDSLVNKRLIDWIEESALLCTPDQIHICDGSLAEYERLANQMVATNTFIPLNEEKRPHSFLARSNPDDVARVEESTFICCPCEVDAGPTNNWCEPEKMKGILRPLFQGVCGGVLCM